LPIKKGDFVTVNYICKAKETEEIVDSTVEVEGYKPQEGEEQTYEPLLVVVGEGWIPKGLDDALDSAEAGKKFEVEVPPDKGYGERDKSKVRLLPLRRFRREKLNPIPGMQLQIDGRPATIRAVGAGRVQVDFNHPLAGKILVYEVTLTKLLSKKADKVKALMHRRLPTLNLEKVGLKVTPNEVSIELPEEVFLVEGLQLSKRQIASEIQKYIPNILEVSFIERVKKPKEKPKAKAKPKEKSREKPKEKPKKSSQPSQKQASTPQDTQ
jgi:peptidylprolyl isomerase